MNPSTEDQEPERWIEQTPEGYIVFKKTAGNLSLLG